MLNTRDMRAIRRKLRAQLKSKQARIDDRSIELRRVGARALSELSRQVAKLKPYERQTRSTLAALRRTGVAVWRDAGQKSNEAWVQSRKTLRPTGLRMTRALHRSLTRLPYYPVEVAARPVPTETDPRISQKVETARLWMQEHGIGDKLDGPPTAARQTKGDEKPPVRRKTRRKPRVDPQDRSSPPHNTNKLSNQCIVVRQGKKPMRSLKRPVPEGRAYSVTSSSPQETS